MKQHRDLIKKLKLKLELLSFECMQENSSWCTPKVPWL